MSRSDRFRQFVGYSRGEAEAQGFAQQDRADRRSSKAAAHDPAQAAKILLDAPRTDDHARVLRRSAWRRAWIKAVHADSSTGQLQHF
jgi:hypothetical protein